MSKITAILLAYYPERAETVNENLKALKSGTVKPDKIVIANNNKDLDFDCHMFKTSKNMGSRFRLSVAMAIPSDFYYFVDDDCVVRERTLENLYNNRIDGVVGYCGKIAENGNYRTPLIYGIRIKSEIETNIIIGVGSMLASFNSLVNMFKLESVYRKHPDYNKGREDDLLLSIPNKSKVIPADNTSMIRIVGSQEVGLYKDDCHVLNRIKVTKSAYETWHSLHSI